LCCQAVIWTGILNGPHMRIFILTGAGISAESGMGTFRDKGCIWAEFDPMELATPEAFAADPGRVHEFYNLRRQNMRQAQPNAAHQALARLQTELARRGGDVFLCTQNIDDLHERAGFIQVHHMHGELGCARCGLCGGTGPCVIDLSVELVCEQCLKTGHMRPDVVWFGEQPFGLDIIDAALARSDLFAAIGTSGAVYPAAGLVRDARQLGIETWEINLEPSDNAIAFCRTIYGPATGSVPEFVERLLAGAGQTTDG
jgi:NAD-dependent deacetylase